MRDHADIEGVFADLTAVQTRSDALEEAAEIADRFAGWYVENTPANKVAVAIAAQIRKKKSER